MSVVQLAPNLAQRDLVCCPDHMIASLQSIRKSGRETLSISELRQSARILLEVPERRALAM